MEAEAAPRSRGREVARRLTATPLIPVVIAVVLGLYRIGDKSFWLDEAYAYGLAHLPIRPMLSAFASHELHGSPYYLSLHVWQWLGSSEGFLRSLSVLYGAMAVFFLFYVAKRYAVAFSGGADPGDVPVLHPVRAGSAGLHDAGRGHGHLDAPVPATYRAAEPIAGPACISPRPH